jgi:hypothetical protein
MFDEDAAGVLHYFQLNRVRAIFRDQLPRLQDYLAGRLIRGLFPLQLPRSGIEIRTLEGRRLLMPIISNVSRLLCGMILITVPTIEYGGLFLLGAFRKREAYMENPLRQSLFRAGHAHAGVLVILSLICQVLVDAIILPAPLAWLARLGAPAAAILVPAGFFFSVIQPNVQRPSGLIALTYVGAAVLAIGVLILGIGLIRAGLA